MTLEANPGPDDRGDLAGFARAGITRLSLGAQSLDDAELRSLGRRHRAGDVADAVLDARAAGIGQVSLDLLYDVPGQRLATWMATVEAALEMGPDHVSVLRADPRRPGRRGPHRPARRPPAHARRAHAAGASGAARGPGRGSGGRRVLAGRRRARGRRACPGTSCRTGPARDAESRHNLVYWERRPYEAVGPGAHAFDGVRRRWNAARLDAWLGALAPGPGGVAAALPPGDGEEIDADVGRGGGAHPRPADGARHRARACPDAGRTRSPGPTRRASWRRRPASACG